jgi:hypothetical protein
MPPRKRSEAPALPAQATDDSLSQQMGALHEQMAGLQGHLDKVLPPEDDPKAYDSAGFVIGHAIWIDAPMEGDLLVAPAPAGYAPPVFRCRGFYLVNEMGVRVPTHEVARPWRLLWRAPVPEAVVDAPKARGKKRADEAEDE